MMKAQELEDRLVDFAVMVIGVVELLPSSKAGNHIGGQMIRSGTSPAPNYGEARRAESRRDFIHKMKISLKELRETIIWLKIISRKQLVDDSLVSTVIAECDELIAIFIASTRTADLAEVTVPINQKSTVKNRQSSISWLSEMRLSREF
jgi:four helix bundle protein